MTIIVTETNL